MKIFRILAPALLLAISFQVSASEVESDVRCQLYSKLGGSMVEFMLPLTMQDLVNMMSGKDPDLMMDMTTGLLSGLDGNDLGVMMKLPGQDAEIAGQAAGDVAMKVLMSGQATSAAEVRTIMKSTCETIGFDTMVANQKSANLATAGNFVE